MEIYNIKTKECDIIPDGDKIPDGWTNIKPLWVLYESFDGKKWVEDKTAGLALEESFKAKQKLVEIDLASIRSIREYIESKSNCPAILKEHEAAAIEERKKIK